MSFLTPTHSAHLRLFVGLIEDELNEYLYDAELAGISGRYASTDMGLMVFVGCMCSIILKKKMLLVLCFTRRLLSIKKRIIF